MRFFSSERTLRQILLLCGPCGVIPRQGVGSAQQKVSELLLAQGELTISPKTLLLGETFVLPQPVRPFCAIAICSHLTSGIPVFGRKSANPPPLKVVRGWHITTRIWGCRVLRYNEKIWRRAVTLFSAKIVLLRIEASYFFFFLKGLRQFWELSKRHVLTSKNCLVWRKITTATTSIYRMKKKIPWPRRYTTRTIPTQNKTKRKKWAVSDVFGLRSSPPPSFGNRVSKKKCHHVMYAPPS